MKEKREFLKPTIRLWGSVSDLTSVGLTNEGDDTFIGDQAGSVCPANNGSGGSPDFCSD